MACKIQNFKMTEKQIANWCKNGCSVDCEKLLKTKYQIEWGKYHNEHKDDDYDADEDCRWDGQGF